MALDGAPGTGINSDADAQNSFEQDGIQLESAVDMSSDEDEEDRESVESGVSESSEPASEGDERSGEAGSNRKKKKKKKKKKKSKDDAGSQSAAHAEENMLPAEVADARYAAAIEGLRSNDEMCMWVQLGKCRVGDKKARKLFEAMKGNKTVTSIDLSENTISDDGLQALATVLAGGAAPDLISLNLKSNPITEKGRAVLSGLQRVRKLVKVDYEDPDAAVDASKMTAEFNESMPKNRWLSGAVNGWDSQDETVRNGMRERGEKDLSPQQKVDAALKAIKDASTSLIPGLLAARIMSVVFMVERELKDESPKAIHKASIDALPKGLSLVAKSASKFVAALALSPRPVPCQRRSAEQAAGRHRVATVELLQRLALACCPSIDEVLLSSGAVVRVRDLMFEYSWSSILHSALARFYEVVVARPGSALAATLFEGEEGLLARLSRAGSEGAILAVDKRPGYLGHVIRISALLKDSAAKHPSLKERLARSKAWQVYASDLGPLDTLLAEQAGDLGGPKPLSLPFFLNGAQEYDNGDGDVGANGNGGGSDADSDGGGGGGGSIVQQLRNLYLTHGDSKKGH